MKLNCHLLSCSLPWSGCRQPRTHIRAFLRVCCLLLCCGWTAIAVPAAAYVNPTDGSPSGHNVLRGFDDLEHNWHAGHRGVDLDATPGSLVLAAGPGTVSFAGVIAGKPVVSIDHGGFRTTYEPVHAEVRQGDEVAEGQRIGVLGHSVDGYPGLHWGAKTGPDDYFNPLRLLEAPEIRLKPVDAPG